MGERSSDDGNLAYIHKIGLTTNGFTLPTLITMSQVVHSWRKLDYHFCVIFNRLTHWQIATYIWFKRFSESWAGKMRIFLDTRARKMHIFLEIGHCTLENRRNNTTSNNTEIGRWELQLNDTISNNKIEVGFHWVSNPKFSSLKIIFQNSSLGSWKRMQYFNSTVKTCDSHERI